MNILPKASIETDNNIVMTLLWYAWHRFCFEHRIHGHQKSFFEFEIFYDSKYSIFCFCYTFKETEQVRATELSIFKQGPRKCALHSAALGAAIYSPRVSCLDLTEGSGMEAGEPLCNQGRSSMSLCPTAYPKQEPQILKRDNLFQDRDHRRVCKLAQLNTGKQLYAKLEPLDLYLAYCICLQVLLGFPPHLSCFLCHMILCSFFRKLLGKQCICPCEQSGIVEKQQMMTTLKGVQPVTSQLIIPSCPSY